MANILNILKAIWNAIVAWKYLWGALLIIFLMRLLPDVINNIRDGFRLRRKFRHGQSWRSDRELLWMLRGMRPDEFEDYIADLFSRMGYKTETTGGAYDEGVDIIAEKDGIEHYIQCKKYFGKHEVGVGEIRDFYGAIADHLASGKGYFITTNKFTLEAERFAEDKPIELVDSFKLIDYIKSVGD